MKAFDLYDMDYDNYLMNYSINTSEPSNFKIINGSFFFSEDNLIITALRLIFLSLPYASFHLRITKRIYSISKRIYNTYVLVSYKNTNNFFFTYCGATRFLKG